MKTPKALLPAIRQYKHNDNSLDFIFGLDLDKTVKIFHKFKMKNIIFLTTGFIAGTVFGILTKLTIELLLLIL